LRCQVRAGIDTKRQQRFLRVNSKDQFAYCEGYFKIQVNLNADFSVGDRWLEDLHRSRHEPGIEPWPQGDGMSRPPGQRTAEPVHGQTFRQEGERSSPDPGDSPELDPSDLQGRLAAVASGMTRRPDLMLGRRIGDALMLASLANT
jgi:hypothetical protein